MPRNKLRVKSTRRLTKNAAISGPTFEGNFSSLLFFSKELDQVVFEYWQLELLPSGLNVRVVELP